MNEFAARWLPLAILIFVLAVAVVLRAWLQWRWFGAHGIRLFAERRADQLVRDTLLVLVHGSLFAQALWRAVEPAGWRLVFAPQLVAAALVALAGGAILLAAQYQLGRSWRIGIDRDSRPGLVTHGLYAWTRNPIFLGLELLHAANALALPTWLSLLALAGALIGVRTQVLAEERYLFAAYGAEFAAYARRVGRFVPRLGRLGGGGA